MEPNKKSKQKGKTSGVKNFSPTEDLLIAKAYTAVSLADAAATPSPDHDTVKFYERVHAKFLETIGDDFVQDRTADSIRNRWLNALQRPILKFVACLTKAVAKEHPHWTSEDYVIHAKKLYFDDIGKQFDMELIWQEVKILPKFAIDSSLLAITSTITTVNRSSTNGDMFTTTPASVHSLTSQHTEDRVLNSNNASHLNIENTEMSASNVSALVIYCKRLLEATEKRNAIESDKFALALFALEPESEETKEFITLKKEEMLLNARLSLKRKRQELENLQHEER